MASIGRQLVMAAIMAASHGYGDASATVGTARLTCLGLARDIADNIRYICTSKNFILKHVVQHTLDI